MAQLDHQAKTNVAALRPTHHLLWEARRVPATTAGAAGAQRLSDRALPLVRQVLSMHLGYSAKVLHGGAPQRMASSEKHMSVPPVHRPVVAADNAPTPLDSEQ